MFADINTFLAPGINEKCNSIEQSEAGDALARLEALIVHSPDNVRLYAPCLITGKDCYYECADTHISGSPCTDMSSYGLGKRETGKTTSFFLICVKHRWLLKEPVVIRENVVAFLVKWIRRLLGDIYVVDTAVLRLDEEGMPVHRDRRYTICVRKDFVIVQPLATIARCLRRPIVGVTANDFLLASDTELQVELNWACSRAGGKKGNASITSPGVFEYALSGFEAKHLAVYKTQKPGGIFGLNQNPSKRGASSNPENYTHWCTVSTFSGMTTRADGLLGARCWPCREYRSTAICCATCNHGLEMKSL